MKIKPIVATVSMVYTPEMYLEDCKAFGDEPTQAGFLRYVMDLADDDFNGGLNLLPDFKEEEV